jgi:protein TonB
MAAKSFTNSFYSGQKAVSFSGFSVILAICANVLIFFLLSWVNRTSAGVPREDYDTIELFKPELMPERLLPPAESMPVIAHAQFYPKPEPVKLTRMKEPLLRPHLTEWMPEALLKLPGVPVDISLAELDASDSGNFSDALAFNQVDKPPQKINAVLPDYPSWAKTKRVEGTVTLRFVVDINGQVRNIEVYSIRGDERFAAVAKKAVEKWRFEPAVNQSKPVAVWCFQKVHFRFED